MSFENYQKYHLSLGTNGETVRIVKQLLHSKSDNSYRDDGNNQYTTKLASAVRELQSRNPLPITGNVGQSEYWLLGKNVPDIRLQHLSKNDRALNNVLRGGILGNTLLESSTSIESTSLSEGVEHKPSITMTGDYWVDYDLDGRTIRNYASPPTELLLNANAGVLATNVLRAIIACNALLEFPTVSTKNGYALSVTFEGSVSMLPTGGAGSVGIKLLGGVSYDTTYDSTDGILRALRIANENIRINEVMEISSHTFAVPNSDRTIPDALKPLGEIPDFDGKSMALSFVTISAESANKFARQIYVNTNKKKTVPSVFYNYATGDIIF